MSTTSGPRAFAAYETDVGDPQTWQAYDSEILIVFSGYILFFHIELLVVFSPSFDIFLSLVLKFLLSVVNQLHYCLKKIDDEVINFKENWWLSH